MTGIHDSVAHLRDNDSVAHGRDNSETDATLAEMQEELDRLRNEVADLALIDDLTGVANRRHLMQRLTEECARSERNGKPFSLLVIDLDGFKTINDTRGHMVGDAVLREVGALLKHARRAGDVVARTGGEEFSIILPDTTPQGALQVATRLCDAVRGQSFLAGQKPLSLTVSIGVVSKSPDLRDDVVEEIKKRADDALYHAKGSGRDCVRVWTSALLARRSGRITESLRVISL